MLRLILAASLTEPATAVSIASVTLSEPACRSATRPLAVLACFFSKSRAGSGTSRFWMFLSASVTGAKACLTLFNRVSVVVVIGCLHPQGLSYGLTPSGLARGNAYMGDLMLHCNIYAATRYHDFVIEHLLPP